MYTRGRGIFFVFPLMYVWSFKCVIKNTNVLSKTLIERKSDSLYLSVISKDTYVAGL